MRVSPLLVVLGLLAACSRNPGADTRGEPLELTPSAPSRGQATSPATREPPISPRTDPHSAPAFDPERPNVAGLTFTAPPPFEHRRPAQPMRVAEYIVPEREGEQAATMTVHHFAGMGGAVRDNLDRWAAQLTKPDGSPITDARITERTVAGMEVSLIDVTGTYRGMTPMGGAAPAQPDQRMLGAIVRSPGGLVFFKLVGPSSVVARAEAAFGALVDSFEVAR